MKFKSEKLFFCFLLIITSILMISCNNKEVAKKISWKHLSSVNGDIEVPNSGQQQTATAVFDVDKDGINDFIITERSTAPAVVWYQYTKDGWKRYVIDKDPLRIEAGSAHADIDGDGDEDIVFGGDGKNNHVWWWENPYPNYDPNVSWNRYEIKNSGADKQHDQMFGDFNGDGKVELVFWNQFAATLFYAEIPEDPKNTEPWEYTAIYTYSNDSEAPPRAIYPGWQTVNSHEGLAAIDIDLDGKVDIVGGGKWFKHIEGTTFEANEVDANYRFSRSAAGQFIDGGRPEIILVVGDGRGPMIMYEWDNEKWQTTMLIDTVQDGHSIDAIDFNGDGHLDIFSAEMDLGKNPDAITRVLLGNGKGEFKDYIINKGFGLHESRIADLDGDGDLDILGKPYRWEAPRLDIWLQE